MMRSIFATLGLTSLLFSSVAFAQGGGKAEPNRIMFPNGKNSVVVTGKLSNGQEMEYVFRAAKGQTAVIKNSRTSLFDFRVFNEKFEFETEFESSPSLTFEIPDSGDYLFFVRKKQVKSPRTAMFKLSITIK